MEEPRKITLLGEPLTEWIKVLFGLLAILLAANEFLLKDRAAQTEKIKNTAEFIRLQGRPDIVASVAALNDAQRSATISKTMTPVEKRELLTKFVPYSQYLRSWSSCVSLKLCDAQSSVTHLCELIEDYEAAYREVATRLDIKYEDGNRQKRYGDMISQCRRITPR